MKQGIKAAIGCWIVWLAVSGFIVWGLPLPAFCDRFGKIFVSSLGSGAEVNGRKRCSQMRGCEMLLDPLHKSK